MTAHRDYIVLYVCSAIQEYPIRTTHNTEKKMTSAELSKCPPAPKTKQPRPRHRLLNECGEGRGSGVRVTHSKSVVLLCAATKPGGKGGKRRKRGVKGGKGKSRSKNQNTPKGERGPWLSSFPQSSAQSRQHLRERINLSLVHLLHTSIRTTLTIVILPNSSQIRRARHRILADSFGGLGSVRRRRALGDSVKLQVLRLPRPLLPGRWRSPIRNFFTIRILSTR